MKVKSESEVVLLATPWTAAYQAPPSMGGESTRVGCYLISNLLSSLWSGRTVLPLPLGFPGVSPEILSPPMSPEAQLTALGALGSSAHLSSASQLSRLPDLVLTLRGSSSHSPVPGLACLPVCLGTSRRQLLFLTPLLGGAF